MRYTSLFLAIFTFVSLTNLALADDAAKKAEPPKPAPSKEKAKDKEKEKEKPAKPKEDAAKEKPAKPKDDKAPAKPKEDKAPVKPAAPKPAENPKPTAVTEIEKADGDYWIQGEYYGRVNGQATGLHVMALGGGKFDAIEFSGGLPGYDWWPGMAKSSLKGGLDGSGVKLTGGDQEISIAAGSATVRDKSQRVLGTLQRVERQSNTMGAAPPRGAIVLFDGTSPPEFTKASVTGDHLLKPGGTTKMPVGDFRLHLEFRTPYKPAGRGQDRGNSGVYIQGRYEVQVLDSFGLESQFNDCASLYRQRKPDLNMSYAPLVWQTYDIWFRAPRFDSTGKKIQNARITVWHNGVAVHNNVEVTAKTGGGKQEGPDPLPISLQDHGNPVTFRNIWLVPDEGPKQFTYEAPRRGLFRRR